MNYRADGALTVSKKRPLWMIELDLDYRDLQRQRYEWLPDLVAIVAACLLIGGATVVAILALVM